MHSHTKRALLYGSAVVTLGAIGYLWQHRVQDADVMTMLSSVNVQLRLAYGMPAADKQGKPLSARVDMIAQADRSLADVERIEPGLVDTAEFTGFSHMLQGRYADAAAHYARAQLCKDCGDEQRDVLAFNQARMLAAAGQKEAALAVFARHADRLDRRFGHQRRLEEATILRQLGRRPEAIQRATVVLEDAAAPSMAALQAGQELFELGESGAAESALARAATELPIANYWLARLKLQQNDVDTCLGLLERAAKAQPTEVRRLLGNEPDAWSTVAADARFQELQRPPAAAPTR
ncbi:MAG: hypothetical protein JNK15_18055 [Planctomycetes bacterium]|nr:hypothetical protein [Planctomycetota bacterium]